ncbi:hypothetical protein L3Q82_025417 [Scortum barcoo]|uniref:Uncharacterized protein n=1 Tax=Scortum barcoo TaxID=214431 RepID=A0ACB8WLW5_9TELE|nr:hypothetical protein L3Q82_025417 [Scortum barcoo]
MINFVVVSSDLRPYVLDTRVKRGAELSTDHHLVVSGACRGGNPRTRWWTQEVRDAYWTMLACGTPDAVDRYRTGQASHSPDGPGGKNFGSGRSSVRPWRRTISRPQRDSGKPSGALLFADDVVLLASSNQDLQHVLERFAAECEVAGMRISTSKSEAMVLDRKRVACPLSGWVERSCLKWRSSSISGLVHE